jgi:hypothetical protein
MNIKKTDMEEKINKAAILKDKPKGTKLYTILSDGECFLNEASEDSIYIDIDNRERFWCLSAYGSTHSFPNGCVLLFPSREMRDWSKFAWKKGDVLINSCGFQCIFKEWASDDYTKFNGCYSNSRDGYEDVSNAETAKFDKLDHNIAYGYVREIERKLGGKLNLETLEIENAHPDFKDGDIVFVGSYMLGINTSSMIAIFRKEKEIDKYKFSPALCEPNEHDTYLREAPVVLSPSEIMIFRPATDSEKQQLFDALAKEGKAWDAEKKMIVNLKPKVELKPFDNVLVRHQKTEEWRANIFSHTDKTDEYLDYVCVNGRWEFCIPYEGNESLLGTTKDVEVSYGRSF